MRLSYKKLIGSRYQNCQHNLIPTWKTQPVCGMIVKIPNCLREKQTMSDAQQRAPALTNLPLIRWARVMKRDIASPFGCLCFQKVYGMSEPDKFNLFHALNTQKKIEIPIWTVPFWCSPISMADFP